MRISQVRGAFRGVPQHLSRGVPRIDPLEAAGNALALADRDDLPGPLLLQASWRLLNSMRCTARYLVWKVCWCGDGRLRNAQRPSWNRLRLLAFEMQSVNSICTWQFVSSRAGFRYAGLELVEVTGLKPNTNYCFATMCAKLLNGIGCPMMQHAYRTGTSRALRP